ncbi:hypothetical protein DEHRE_09245 [Dehalobacter restrictus DSM 9455]|uniref:Uncharacterized protein n=1 Tax=Dehalobacter restrictus (strain DSM 9455 / PER-K23) TaxID=871738 RepID=A0ABM5P9E9_DEHRP|nr:hypothetical protein DEHRE_09245 [Dehalobacter restrictus DSM 9455]
MKLNGTYGAYGGSFAITKEKKGIQNEATEKVVPEPQKQKSWNYEERSNSSSFLIQLNREKTSAQVII